MSKVFFPGRIALGLVAAMLGTGAAGLAPAALAAERGALHEASSSRHAASPKKPALDLSGRKRVGKASFYARKFAGRKMANGKRMDPRRDVAASKTLPLGTKAKVTNLETGKSAVVTIEDRGPFVKGRIVDLSPATAQKVGITPSNGVAPVEVAPIKVPQPGGDGKPGGAAPDTKADKHNAGDR